jgi:hypothetical protein
MMQKLKRLAYVAAVKLAYATMVYILAFISIAVIFYASGHMQINFMPYSLLVLPITAFLTIQPSAVLSAIVALFALVFVEVK